MNKKLAISILLLLSIITAVSLAYLISNKNKDNLTDQEIKDKYCHVTAEVRKTDVYCQNPELYRQDVRNKTIITD